MFNFELFIADLVDFSCVYVKGLNYMIVKVLHC